MVNLYITHPFSTSSRCVATHASALPTTSKSISHHSVCDNLLVEAVFCAPSPYKQQQQGEIVFSQTWKKTYLNVCFNIIHPLDQHFYWSYQTLEHPLNRKLHLLHVKKKKGKSIHDKLSPYFAQDWWMLKVFFFINLLSVNSRSTQRVPSS